MLNLRSAGFPYKKLRTVYTNAILMYSYIFYCRDGSNFVFCRVVKVTAFMLLAVENLRYWQPRFELLSFDATLDLLVCLMSSASYCCSNYSRSNLKATLIIFLG